MPTLLFRSPSDSGEAWREALQSRMPGLDVRVHPETGDLAGIEYALVWAAPDRMLHEMPDLKVVFSLGAGVDHLLDGSVPEGVPIVRMVDPALTEGMVEYVLYHVLRHHRGMPRYERQQARAEWLAHGQRRPGERTVGILGLGELGGACATALAGLGFRVRGYSRSRRTLDGIESFAGENELNDFLADCEFLVCLLPLTEATRGMLNRDLFARLPADATLIHAGRGAHLVETDLLEGLEAGRPAHAVLDVFGTEPLPTEHPFWHHDRITVTPHVASLTNPWTGALRIVDGIRRHQTGEPLPDVIDPARGY